MHIGRRCVLDMILLAKEKGMASVKANICSFNKQSQAMFLSIGFIQTDDEWYEYKLQIVYNTCTNRTCHWQLLWIPKYAIKTAGGRIYVCMATGSFT